MKHYNRIPAEARKRELKKAHKDYTLEFTILLILLSIALMLVR